MSKKEIEFDLVSYTDLSSGSVGYTSGDFTVTDHTLTTDSVNTWKDLDTTTNKVIYYDYEEKQRQEKEKIFKKVLSDFSDWARANKKKIDFDDFDDFLLDGVYD